MKKKIIRYISFLYIAFLVFSSISCISEDSPASRAGRNTLDVQRVKVALRSVGNQLLLSQNDSTSLVLPVTQQKNATYELAFEKPLAFDPTTLNEVTGEVFDRANLPKNYLVEVIQCNDGEVAYSYEAFGDTEKDIISCGGRVIPEMCYTIRVLFRTTESQSKTKTYFFYALIFLVLAFLVFVFYSRYHTYHSETQPVSLAGEPSDATVLGSFHFYPEQNKLVKQAQDIPLSRKECELLAIFVANANQVVKREELTKQVWEDNGVIVGRSLDTYISKLRKKLQDDDSIKLTNIHGVGYKLEVSSK